MAATDAVAPAPPAASGPLPHSKTCGLCYDAVMELHMREGHPEHPRRVQVLQQRLQQTGLLDRCTRLPSKLATTEELLACHSQAHIDRVDGLYEAAPSMAKADGAALDRIGDAFIITGDIFCNANTRVAARSAAGCAVQAVGAVLSGEVDTAFAMVRPPGHHAESAAEMGFCFFNNVAVAAARALRHPGVERVLIFDWDVHHGNGTQQIFEGDPRVLFVSLHRRDEHFYPQGVGYETEVGKGAGAGFNVNVPWSSKGMGDQDYMAAYELLLAPILAAFDPQLVLISAGFDAAEGDFLGKCCVTPEGFAAMTAALLRLAGGKVVAVLEGGYEASVVASCACAMVRSLLGDAPPRLPVGKLHKSTQGVLTRVDGVMRPFWPSLAALPPLEVRFRAHKAALDLEALTLAQSSKGAGGGVVTRRHAASTAAAASAAKPAAAAAGAPRATMTPAASAAPAPAAAAASASSVAACSTAQVFVHAADADEASGAPPLAASAPPLTGRAPPQAGKRLIRIKLPPSVTLRAPAAPLAAPAAAAPAAAAAAAPSAAPPAAPPAAGAPPAPSQPVQAQDLAAAAAAAEAAASSSMSQLSAVPAAGDDSAAAAAPASSAAATPTGHTAAAAPRPTGRSPLGADVSSSTQACQQASTPSSTAGTAPQPKAGSSSRPLRPTPARAAAAARVQASTQQRAPAAASSPAQAAAAIPVAALSVKGQGSSAAGSMEHAVHAHVVAAGAAAAALGAATPLPGKAAGGSRRASTPTAAAAAPAPAAAAAAPAQASSPASVWDLSALLQGLAVQEPATTPMPPPQRAAPPVEESFGRAHVAAAAALPLPLSPDVSSGQQGSADEDDDVFMSASESGGVEE